MNGKCEVLRDSTKTHAMVIEVRRQSMYLYDRTCQLYVFLHIHLSVIIQHM
jgi:hypothetical protein